jgi:hypothetical protein
MSAVICKRCKTVLGIAASDEHALLLVGSHCCPVVADAPGLFARLLARVRGKVGAA